MTRSIKEILEDILQEQTATRRKELLIEFLTHPATQPRTPLSVEPKTDPEEIVDLFLLFLGEGDTRIGEKVLVELAKRSSRYGIKRINIPKTRGEKIRDQLVRMGAGNPRKLLRFLADVVVPERYVVHEGRKALNALRMLAYSTETLDRITIGIIKKKGKTISTIKQRLGALASDSFSPIHERHPLFRSIEELEEHINKLEEKGINKLRSKLEDAHIVFGNTYRELLEEASEKRLEEIRKTARELHAKK